LWPWHCLSYYLRHLVSRRDNAIVTRYQRITKRFRSRK
jgi:hypothetical protein